MRLEEPAPSWSGRCPPTRAARPKSLKVASRGTYSSCTAGSPPRSEASCHRGSGRGYSARARGPQLLEPRREGLKSQPRRKGGKAPGAAAMSSHPAPAKAKSSGNRVAVTVEPEQAYLPRRMVRRGFVGGVSSACTTTEPVTGSPAVEPCGSRAVAMWRKGGTAA
jgi:hypothetical protein